MAAMIPAILRSWSTVEVEVDSQTIFACPFNGAKEVAPGYLRDIRITGVGRDSPV